MSHKNERFCKLVQKQWQRKVQKSEKQVPSLLHAFWDHPTSDADPPPSNSKPLATPCTLLTIPFYPKHTLPHVNSDSSLLELSTIQCHPTTNQQPSVLQILLLINVGTIRLFSFINSIANICYGCALSYTFIFPKSCLQTWPALLQLSQL